MITEEQHLLICINEECLEIGKAVDKILRFNHIQGPHQENNLSKLREEINDLFAVIEMYYNETIIHVRDYSLIQNKKDKVTHYLKYAGLRE